MLLLSGEKCCDKCICNSCEYQNECNDRVYEMTNWCENCEEHMVDSCYIKKGRMHQLRGKKCIKKNQLIVQKLLQH